MIIYVALTPPLRHQHPRCFHLLGKLLFQYPVDIKQRLNEVQNEVVIFVDIIIFYRHNKQIINYSLHPHTHPHYIVHVHIYTVPLQLFGHQV